jgi:hypothetical protein
LHPPYQITGSTWNDQINDLSELEQVHDILTALDQCDCVAQLKLKFLEVYKIII